MNNKILFLGDICTDSYSCNDLELFKNTKLYSFLKTYNGYIIGNLEAPLLEGRIFENKNKFSLINKLELSGFYDFCDAFNLANNHIMDQGNLGFQQTIKNINELQSSYFGAGEDLYKSRTPLIIELGKHKIAILSYCCYSTNSEHYADLSTIGPAPIIFEYINEDVEKIKGDVDFIYVMLHWGVENEFYPTYDQVALARKIIDLGVDGIIGGHTHTIQSFETYNNKEIFYSIGNLFFNNFNIDERSKYFQGKYNKEGLLVEVDLNFSPPVINRYPILMDKDMIPELSSFEEIKTDVLKNNKKLNEFLSNFEHKNLSSNLQLSLKFNGSNMQVINESPFVFNDYKPRIESFKSKIKRVVYYQLKKRINKDGK